MKKREYDLGRFRITISPIGRVELAIRRRFWFPKRIDLESKELRQLESLCGVASVGISRGDHEI